MRRSNPAGLHLYRDRRRRLKRLRWARRAAAILAALLALILAIRLLARPQSPGPAPGPLATEPAPEVDRLAEEIYKNHPELTPVNYESPALLPKSEDAGQEYIEVAEALHA